MAEKIALGQNIKAILDILEWSQTDLAEKLNVTQPTVSKWLDGEIDDEKLLKISAALEMPVEFIKKFRQAKTKNEINQTNTYNKEGIGFRVGFQQIEQQYNESNVNEFIILEKEKQILLIEGHIGQLRILKKMNNCNEGDIQEIDAQIEENREKIEALKNDIQRYRDNK